MKTIKNILKFLLNPVCRKIAQKRAWRLTTANNRLIVVENGIERAMKFNEFHYKLKICVLVGRGNTLKIHLPIKTSNSAIIFENNDALVEIGENAEMHNSQIYIQQGKGQICKIGRNTLLNTLITVKNTSTLIIGENCLFGANTAVRTSDAHSVLDRETGEILNKTVAPLTIGNNCWISQNAQILKHGSLPDWTIVGAMSLVTRPFTESHTVVAGNPAKVVRRNVIWNRKDWYDLEQENISKKKLVSEKETKRLSIIIPFYNVEK
jgi:acetyltransferase-like isoleucine patch superfamily enzyme